MNAVSKLQAMHQATAERKAAERKAKSDLWAGIKSREPEMAEFIAAFGAKILWHKEDDKYLIDSPAGQEDRASVKLHAERERKDREIPRNHFILRKAHG